MNCYQCLFCGMKMLSIDEYEKYSLNHGIEANVIPFCFKDTFNGEPVFKIPLNCDYFEPI